MMLIRFQYVGVWISVHYRPSTGCGTETVAGFTGMCSPSHNTSLNLRFQIRVYIIFKVAVVQMKAHIVYVVMLSPKQTSRQLPHHPRVSLLAVYNFLHFGFVMAQRALNARKSCFGNHCCPCHRVSLTSSGG